MEKREKEQIHVPDGVRQERSNLSPVLNQLGNTYEHLSNSQRKDDGDHPCNELEWAHG
jgi:hypothetical protein